MLSHVTMKMGALTYKLSFYDVTRENPILCFNPFLKKLITELALSWFRVLWISNKEIPTNPQTDMCKMLTIFPCKSVPKIRFLCPLLLLSFFRYVCWTNFLIHFYYFKCSCSIHLIFISIFLNAENPEQSIIHSRV